MNSLLSFLGALPASTSIKGKLNGLDYQKTIRMAIVAAGAYVAVAILEKLMHDMLGWGLPEGVTTQLVVVATPLLELLRRRYASAFQG